MFALDRKSIRRLLCVKSRPTSRTGSDSREKQLFTNKQSATNAPPDTPAGQIHQRERKRVCERESPVPIFQLCVRFALFCGAIFAAKAEVMGFGQQHTHVVFFCCLSHTPLPACLVIFRHFDGRVAPWNLGYCCCCRATAVQMEDLFCTHNTHAHTHKRVCFDNNDSVKNSKTQHH